MKTPTRLTASRHWVTSGLKMYDRYRAALSDACERMRQQIGASKDAAAPE
jgi:hypothetical protein